MKRLIVIVGPTGSGKTDLSLHLAAHYRAPILSADSRQVYRGMAIGTAQPTAEQLQLAEHHFINCIDLNQHFNCGIYETEALVLLEKLFQTHDTVIAVGGSGLYIKALCEGMDALPEVDDELRATLNGRLETEGVDALADELQQRDPEYYDVVDRKNPARVVRALEVCMQTGKPYSSFRHETSVERDFDIIKIGIDLPRPVLYARIDARVDQMLVDGLEAEARALIPYRHLKALKTVGYSEMFDYFDGKCTLAEAVELIKRNSRRYAKRQLTWFRRDPEIFWIPPAFEKIISYISTHEKTHSGRDRGNR